MIPLLYEHQQTGLDRSLNQPDYALLMEQGTGKSRVILESFYMLDSVINGLLIIAPNGVHCAWILNQLPIHIASDDIDRTRPHYWGGGKTKKERDMLDIICTRHDTCMDIFAINIDAVITKQGKYYCEQFLKSHDTMMVIDESTRIKNMSAKRTKTIINLGKSAKYRRILTGTPITQSPLDLYAQFYFLNPKIFGFKSYYSFRARYAILKTGYGPGGRTFKQVVDYKNLDDLHEKIKPYSYRVLKKDCLDLPPKIYKRVYCELSVNQNRLYHQLCNEYIIEEQGKIITAAFALTRLMRLQQIIGGFIQYDDNSNPTVIDNKIPRMETLKKIIEDTPISTKIIIWARFVPEIEMIIDYLVEEYGPQSIVSYYGEISKEDRITAVNRFQEDDTCRFFVGNTQTGGLGITLTSADTVIYYSNDFSLENRLQSEDRCHRIGQKKSVVYYDIEALNTVDGKIIKALQSKQKIADLVVDGIGDLVVNAVNDALKVFSIQHED